MRAGATARRRLDRRGCDGGALVLIVLWCPLLLLLMALAADTGRIWLARQGVRQAAEAGALAGAGQVQWATLAAGVPQLDRAAAHQAATRLALANLRLAFGEAAAAGRVDVDWIEGDGVGTGPGVRLRVEMPVHLIFLPGRPLAVTGEAAAALVPKYRPARGG